MKSDEKIIAFRETLRKHKDLLKIYDEHFNIDKTLNKIKPNRFVKMNEK